MPSIASKFVSSAYNDSLGGSAGGVTYEGFFLRNGRSFLEKEPGGVVGVGWKDKSGEGMGGGISTGGGSDRRRLRDRFFNRFSGFSEGFLRESRVRPERPESLECMLNVSDGRAVAVVDTLMLEVLA